MAFFNGTPGLGVMVSGKQNSLPFRHWVSAVVKSNLWDRFCALIVTAENKEIIRMDKTGFIMYFF
jgi:hypothetical protein